MEDWKDYKQLRNSVKPSLRTAESNYVRNQIEKCKGTCLVKRAFDIDMYYCIAHNEKGKGHFSEVGGGGGG